VRRVPLSCFAGSDSFSAVPRASDPDFMSSVPGHVLGGAEGVRSRSRRYRGYRVPFSCFALPCTFLAVPRALCLIFIFCAPRLVCGGTEGVGYRFHVLRARTHFWRYRLRQFPISCFAHPDSFSAVPRASGPVFIFCPPELVFGGTKGVGSRFHVLRFQTRFRRCQGRRVPFSCFAHPESFSTVPRAFDPILMFSDPGHVFNDTDGVASRFHALHARISFWRN
jgi:hypothetical protein